MKELFVKTVSKIIAVSALMLSASIPARAYETAMEYQSATAAAPHVQHRKHTYIPARAAMRTNAYAPADRSIDTPVGVDLGIGSQR
jgi:hypothetical protein